MKTLLLILTSALLFAPQVFADGQPSLLDSVHQKTVELYALECDFRDPVISDTRKPLVIDLGSELSKLFFLPCVSGAYNIASVIMISDAEGVVSPVLLPFPEIEFEYDDNGLAIQDTVTISKFSSQPYALNFAYNEQNKQLITFEKWRGAGDAFSVGTWELVGKEFVLKKYEVDVTFDGQINSEVIFDETNSAG